VPPLHTLFVSSQLKYHAVKSRPSSMASTLTVLRCQRRRFRKHWAKLSARRTVGRPPVNAEIIALVRKMASANPLWGAPRIHGELLKLGIDVAERTVSRLIRKRRAPPSQTWRTFLTNHVRDLVSIDFFTVPIAGLHVLFVFVVLAHHRRHVLHFNITEHPTAAWTAQQIVAGFPDDTAPAYLSSVIATPSTPTPSVDA
jgi:putative transposase